MKWRTIKKVWVNHEGTLIDFLTNHIVESQVEWTHNVTKNNNKTVFLLYSKSIEYTGCIDFVCECNLPDNILKKRNDKVDDIVWFRQLATDGLLTESMLKF